jgi:predicted ATPase
LFSSVEIRRVGRKESDPFQVQVNVSGQAFNLVDVGYGVSQVLPIIVDVLRGPVRSTFLLQQPEVHLHPRAQAALGSFLASLVSLQKKRLVVETHSDYLVDRVRMDVRDGRVLKPEQVLILYFERHPGHVEIQPIELDEHGNLREVPEGYRSFFLEEDRRLLGIA